MKWTWGWWLFIFAILFKVMHSVLFILFSFSQLRKHFLFFPFRDYIFRTVNKNVGAGINTLMSISDGLGLSIFCQKMEKARPMREEMDGKVVYCPPESAFLSLMLYFLTVLFPLCTLTWRVNNYVFRQEKLYIGEMKVQSQKSSELFS